VLELAAPDITAAIHQAAAAETFQVEQITLEIAGVCPRCYSDNTDQLAP
jgi:Fur family zinc uptake transcriptional regulator